MSAPEWTSGDLLTLGDWAELPEESERRLELVEGIVHVNARPVFGHQRAIAVVIVQLAAQLPPELEVLPEVEVVVRADFPPTVRCPDLVIVPTEISRTNPARCEAASVMAAIEVLSDGSRRTDRVMKFAEYAEAGIEHYWIIDLGPPATIVAYRLSELAYRLDVEGSGVVALTEPVPISIDLDALRP